MMDRELEVRGELITCSHSHPSTAAAATDTLSLQRYLSIVAFLGVVILLLLYLVTNIYWSFSFPYHPTVSVYSASSPSLARPSPALARADEVRFAIRVSNRDNSRDLSFTNFTLTAFSFDGVASVLPRKPFQVAGFETTLLWFSLLNATVMTDPYGVATVSLEMNASVRCRGVEWPATHEETLMSARCDSVKISSYVNNDGDSIAAHCEWRSGDQWGKDEAKFSNDLFKCFCVAYVVVLILCALYKPGMEHFKVKMETRGR